MRSSINSDMRFAIALGMSLGFCHGWIASDSRALAFSGWAIEQGSAMFLAPAAGGGVSYSP